MKIGILTLPFNNNYGGYLQAIALSETLRTIGHHPVIINRRNNPISFKKKIKYFALGIRGLINKNKKHPFLTSSEKVFYHKGQKMIPFAKKYLKDLTPPIYSSQDLKKYSDEFDAFIVGSDQVWRPIYVPDIEDFFFRFLDNSHKKRIAYAASFGNSTPEFNNAQIIDCGELLKKFNAVSLREESGKDVISNFNWHYQDIKIVLDPTLLVEKEQYVKMIGNTTIDVKNKLFCYVLDSNEHTLEIERILGNIYCLTPVYLLDRTGWKKRKYVMPSIQDWLNGIYSSDFVFTDSYHGTVFSIIFNKPFVVYANKIRGIDRFKTLLHFFNLENRLITEPSQINKKIATAIDWKDVNDRLQRGREQSLDFLKSSLI